MQPPTPLQGLRRITWCAGISISWSCGQRASAIRLSLPRQARLSSIARVAARQRPERIGEIGAAQAERMRRRVRILDRPRQRGGGGGEPAPGVEADRMLDARELLRLLKREQRGVEAGELGRDLLRRRWRRRARQTVLRQPGAPGRGAAPFALAGGQRREHAGGIGQSGR